MACLCISCLLWLFVSMGKDYQYNYSIPVFFVNENHPGQQIHCDDSIIDVHLTSSGFDWLASRMFLRKIDNLEVDVNSLSLNTRSGSAKVPTGFLNNRILSAIGMDNVPIEIMPDTLVLRWQKTFAKRVPLVNRVKVETKQPFGVWGEVKLGEDFLFLEGSREALEKVDTIYTKDITIRGIDRNLLTFVPIDFENNDNSLSLQMSTVPLRVEVNEYTENTITIPIEAIVAKNESIRLFPPTVRLKYKVALEDYKKVATDDITAYVLGAGKENNSKLKVMLNNVPDYIKVISLSPPRVDYIIEK